MSRRAALRRIIAAIALIGAAFGSAMFWGEGSVDTSLLWPNLVVAAAGLVFLHLRWRRRERRALTPSRIRDTFE